MTVFLPLLGAAGCQKSSENQGGHPKTSVAKATAEPTKAKMAPLPMVKNLASRTVILTYHDMVHSRDDNSVWFDCTQKELEEQLDFLTGQGAVFLSLSQLYDGLTGRAVLKPKSIVITFADNYQGFYDLAWPILKEKKIPVTLFVHTGHVGSQKGRPKMSWRTLEELQQSGLVSVQSQTVSHPVDLTKLPLTSLEQEFRDSKEAIEAELKTKCWAIAYPNGKFNHDTSIVAARTGYLIGFTEAQAPAETAPDIHRVPRWVHTKWKEAWNSVN